MNRCLHARKGLLLGLSALLLTTASLMHFPKRPGAPRWK